MSEMKPNHELPTTNLGRKANQLLSRCNFAVHQGCLIFKPFLLLPDARREAYAKKETWPEKSFYFQMRDKKVVIVIINL